MTYDFTTAPDRRGTGSYKWDAQAQRLGECEADIVPLSVADMEFDEAPQIREALVEFCRTGTFGYTEPTDEYYDAVLGWQLSHHRWTPDVEWLVLSPGVVPAIYNAVRCVTRPGDGVIIQTPVYYPFSRAISENGRRVVTNPLVRDDQGHYTIDFEDLAQKAADPLTTALVLCSPHNPVGRVWTPEELRRIVDICLANDVFIISDEIHNDLIMPNYLHTTIMKVMELEEWGSCMVCTAPSKTFNLAGAQVSNIFIPNEAVRARFVADFEHSSINENNCFGLVACQAAYDSCSDWLDELIDVIDTNDKLVRAWFTEHLPEAIVSPLEGTYLLWVDLRCLGLSNEQLESLMVDDAKLILDEGYLFGVEGSGFERINLAAPTHVIQTSLDRLASALDARANG